MEINDELDIIIDRYINNEMGDIERQHFEARLIGNDELNQEVTFRRAIVTKLHKDNAKSVLDRIRHSVESLEMAESQLLDIPAPALGKDEHQIRRRYSLIRPLLLVAASIILILLVWQPSRFDAEHVGSEALAQLDLKSEIDFSNLGYYRIQPGVRDAKMLYAWLVQGDMCFKRKDFSCSKEAYGKGIELFESQMFDSSLNFSSNDLYFKIALCNIELELYEEAAKILEHHFALDEQVVEDGSLLDAKYLFGIVSLKVGNKSAGKKQLYHLSKFQNDYTQKAKLHLKQLRYF